jgi:hypothetical protein
MQSGLMLPYYAVSGIWSRGPERDKLLINMALVELQEKSAPDWIQMSISDLTLWNIYSKQERPMATRIIKWQISNQY